ncbi:uncharacterized protein [Typha latifolia]|uniref:uncharacterized protein n=1 Tax=Typha latifolia TaxID=4733 RepID=UPI003C30BE15
MESLSTSTSTFSSKLVESSLSHQSSISSLRKIPTCRIGCPRYYEKVGSLKVSRLLSCNARLRALSRDVSGSSEGDEGAFVNGFGLIPDLDSSLLESDMIVNGINKIGITELPKEEVRLSVDGGRTNESRAGLFRTPISGGVQSATSTHDLPPPALAVRNLMEQARFGHLSTIMSRMHHHREGYPFGSLVDFAADPIGHPIFSFSPLAIHTRNLLGDPRSTLVVQIPGWSGLSNARVTIFGDIVPIPADFQEWGRQQYKAKHQQWASQKWGNFHYYRMQSISDIYFMGGFGTVAWVDVKEYEATQPDRITVDGGEQNLKELNAMFSKSLKEILSTEEEIDDAAFISIDNKGTDIRVRQGTQFHIQRLSFEVEHGVRTLEEAKAALQKIINKGCRSKSHSRT